MMTASVISPNPTSDSSYGSSEAIARGTCARCRTVLGRIINRGAVCKFCHQRVCKSCREYMSHSATEWICTGCHKQMNANSKCWLSELVERTSDKLHLSIKNTLQRSLTFSESSPSPWSALRGSPELRAYSSMPRHDSDYAPKRRQLLNQANQEKKLESKKANISHVSCTQNEFKVVDTCGAVMDIPTIQVSPLEVETSTPKMSPSLPGNHGSPTSSVIHNLRKKMVDMNHLPPGVTPPRRRRLFINGKRVDELQLPSDATCSPIFEHSTGRMLLSDGEDYKLVFLSSPDSSSREEIQSDDASSTCSGAMSSFIDDCDWDYFENSSKTVPILSNFEDFHNTTRNKTQKSILVPVERESEDSNSKQHKQGSGASCEVVGASNSNSTTTGSHSSYLGDSGSCVPLPIPVPIPIPIFVPVPCNNPEFRIRIEHYLSPNFWTEFLLNNNNFLSTLTNHNTSNNQLANGNNEILYDFFNQSSSNSTNLRPSRSMENSRLITNNDVTDNALNNSNNNNSSNTESMILNNKIIHNKSESVVLKNYKKFDEDNKTSLNHNISLHPDDGDGSSLSDSSVSSSDSKAPVKRKYTFNKNDQSNEDDHLDESSSSSSDSSECSSDENEYEVIEPKDNVNVANNNNKDISLSAILNFNDNSKHNDDQMKSESKEIILTSDLITEQKKNENLCDNSNNSISNGIDKPSRLGIGNNERFNDNGKLRLAHLDLTEIKNAETDTRSSDEFSGTESMELAPNDEEQGHIRSELAISESYSSKDKDQSTTTTSTGPFTSLIMITEEHSKEEEDLQERNSPVSVNVVTSDTTTFVPKDKDKFKLTLNTSQPPEEMTELDTSNTSETSIKSEDGQSEANSSQEQVRVVTGGNTLSAVVCLEEGLADDDSWVEELDREEISVTDSSEEENFPDREEELRGYHRTAIDYSLFTIVEESCEESEVETEKSLPTQLENYFLNRIGGGDTISLRIDDAISETSSIFSEDVESADNLDQDELKRPYTSEIGTSRLEQYFLTEFMGFSRRDSDGSVGSDSEGRPTPEQRRKRLVRARGTGRQHSTSLDNLVESEQQVEMQLESEDSSSESDSKDESCSFDKNDGLDTVKRTKKKKRSVTSAPSLEMLDIPAEHSSSPREEVNSENENDDQIELMNQSDRNKHQSRDSGFMGSSDDLIKETKTVEPDVNLSKVNKEEENIPEAKQDVVESSSTTSPQTPIMSIPPATALSRKDSFNNWSSDEETNLMMSKMKAFFKTMVANQPKPISPTIKQKPHKPPQLVYFENELTRLMKTVPGIREDQVKEIVEYLSSEDTWSDSYDSSDYTSSDLEIGNKTKPNSVHAGLNLEGRDSALVYQRLLASFQKVDTTISSDSSASQNSPPLIAKVMQHIGSRLVALMHEVSSGEGAPSPRMSRYHRRVQHKLSNISTTTEEEEDPMEEYASLPRSKSHDPLLEEARQEASDNERFSWRGSFESALMVSDSRSRLPSGSEMSNSASALAIANAKRRSAGDLLFKSQSREQLDRVRSCGSIGGSVEDKIWGMRHPKRRRSSVPDSAANSGGSADGEDDSEEDGEVEIGKSTTLPRSLQSSCSAGTNSLPRLPTSTAASPSIYKAHSAHHVNVKSARYRPPGYNSRGSNVAAPPRRDNRRRSQMTPPPIAAHLVSNSLVNTDDLSLCSDPVNRSGSSHIEDDALDRLNPKSTLGARSDSMASVYSGAGDGRYGSVTVRGEVEFGLQYNYKAGALEIYVKQCKDLAPVDTKRIRSDPYVKVYLLPDKSKAGKRKTRVKKHTLNPIFDEVLKFHLSLEDLECRTLWLSVWHSDMFGRNDFLGEIMMPLENKVFDDPSPKCYTLQERSEVLDELISSKGELIIGLKFVPPEESSSKKNKLKGNLHILIKEAKNLCPIKTNSTIDAFCKAYLLPDKGRSSKHKTGIIKRSTSPSWNHTIVYRDITLDELSERCLELTLWHHDRLTSNELLGGIRLNMGHGKHYGKLVDWMDSSGKEVLLWQQMMERPNFWVESCIPLRSSLDLKNN